MLVAARALLLPSYHAGTYPLALLPPCLPRALPGGGAETKQATTRKRVAGRRSSFAPPALPGRCCLGFFATD